jgi:hypothetical protein
MFEHESIAGAVAGIFALASWLVLRQDKEKRLWAAVALAVAVLVLVDELFASMVRAVWGSWDFEPRYWGAYVILWGAPLLGALTCAICIFVIFKSYWPKTSLDYSDPASLRVLYPTYLTRRNSSRLSGAPCRRAKTIRNSAWTTSLLCCTASTNGADEPRSQPDFFSKRLWPPP